MCRPEHENVGWNDVEERNALCSWHLSNSHKGEFTEDVFRGSLFFDKVTVETDAARRHRGPVVEDEGVG